MSKLPLTYRDHAELVHFAHTLTDQSAALSRFSSREIFISVALAFPVKKNAICVDRPQLILIVIRLAGTCKDRFFFKSFY